MHPQVSHIAAKLIDSQLPGSYFGENIVRNSKRNHFLFTPVCHIRNCPVLNFVVFVEAMLFDKRFNVVIVLGYGRTIREGWRDFCFYNSDAVLFMEG